MKCTSYTIRVFESSRLKWAGNLCRIVIGKPERNGVLGRIRRRWEDNIIKDLK
jgi:hypothetical protein